MSAFENKFYRLLIVALAALERIPARSRTSKEKYAIEQIDKEIKAYRRSYQ